MPLIYGLEASSRCLCAGPVGGSGGSSPESGSFVRFLAGTQVLRGGENYVHLLEYVEETHSLSKAVFRHEAGEVCSLSCSPAAAATEQLIASSYSNLEAGGESADRIRASLWRLPIDVSSSILDEESNLLPLERVMDLNPGKSAGSESDAQLERSVVWKSDESGDECLTFSEERIYVWDIRRQAVKRTLATKSSKGSALLSKLSRVSCIRWSPHSSASILGLAIGSGVVALDLRLPDPPSTPAWTIASAHNHLIRDLDFNPNAQYVLATAGDDCESRFWDVRRPTAPAVSLANHAHWIWSIRFNQFHDQLVLTCSSDSKVVLSRVASLASQPFGHLLLGSGDVMTGEGGSSSEDEVLLQQQMLRKRAAKQQEDGASQPLQQQQDKVIATFEEHEDSVYAAEWSPADPWTFASLSFDGRIVINKVPRSEKMDILF